MILCYPGEIRDFETNCFRGSPFRSYLKRYASKRIRRSLKADLANLPTTPVVVPSPNHPEIYYMVRRS